MQNGDYRRDYNRIKFYFMSLVVQLFVCLGLTSTPTTLSVWYDQQRESLMLFSDMLKWGGKDDATNVECIEYTQYIKYLQLFVDVKPKQTYLHIVKITCTIFFPLV